MGYRGSKSVSLSSGTVKEQRVDGGWHNKTVFKVYSNGFWKKLSNQNPFKSNKLTAFIGYSGNNYFRVSAGTDLPVYLNRGFSSSVNCQVELTRQLTGSDISIREPAPNLSVWCITGFADA